MSSLPPKVLIIGSGGREHAIATAFAQSAHRPQLYFAPGNPGMEPLGQRLDIEPTDIQGLCLYAQREAIDLTFVGPEAPLSAGIVDAFQNAGLPIFGPSQKAAQLEASKSFAKAVMAEAQVPTAGYVYCDTMEVGLKALDQFTPPYVIKEDGLAAGKGVTVTAERSEAEAALKRAFDKSMPVVIEEFLKGEELSVMAICDGTTALPLVSAQDFKRVGDDNQGPNTGGMGAYAPVPFVTPELMAQIQETVLIPMLQAMARRGAPFVGILYAGLMIDFENTQRPVAVVEFNVRFGDPETQVILPLVQSDLWDLCQSALRGTLAQEYPHGVSIQSHAAAVTVVLASQGYPDVFEKGFPITMPQPLPPQTHVFHGGTRKTPEGHIVTHGGRVLNVTGLGPSLKEARERAYALVQNVHFQNKYYRSDIALSASLKAFDGHKIPESIS